MERKKACDYPRELLNLFDLYAHGDIDRAQQVKKDNPRIKTEYLSVASPQGNGSIKGLFVAPAKASGKLPGHQAGVRGVHARTRELTMSAPGRTVRGILRRHAAQDVALGGRSLTERMLELFR